MKAIVLTLLIPFSAAAAEPEKFYCNVPELLGSSYDEHGSQDYGATRTRVWWFDGSHEKVKIASQLVEKVTVELEISRSVSWDKADRRYELATVNAQVDDHASGAQVIAEGSFPIVKKGVLPHLIAVTTYNRPNKDRVQVTCVNPN